ncbi:MAG: AAA family ATPase [Deltaproteobacteria bacterium]|nr:AAA family ATPase [Deltaproteobacteria bacterium]
MISKVVIRRFKRFEEVSFDIPGHIVLAGPNNTGKTTLLQAIASWSLALDRWKQLNDFNPRQGYVKAPIARQAFASVPLRSFDMLWNRRQYTGNLEIEVTSTDNKPITMEFISDSTEQIYVRPRAEVDPSALKKKTLSAVYIPPMTGLGTEEPLYQPPKIAQLLGQAKPGEVIRNLLVQAKYSETAWQALTESIKRLFGYELIPPDETGADILAQYRHGSGEKELDIASAGSGFQQILMLLTFLHTRPASILLIDEPDAHLHVVLQDAIYSELRSVAMDQHSQLIIATHSEVIIDSVEPRELFAMFDGPRPIADNKERASLMRSLSILSNVDIIMAQDAPGILYVEGHTDIAILREWARILNHKAYDLLTRTLFWKPTVWESRLGAGDVQAREHYDALQLVKPGIPGLMLLDGDCRVEVTASQITGIGLQRVRWKRYEIESYLVHPAALRRFVENQVGEDAAEPHLADLDKYFQANFPPPFIENPLSDPAFLISTKARVEFIPPALEAAGLFNIPYTKYNEIAAVMLPEEIHPEIIEKLDAICSAFNIPL